MGPRWLHNDKEELGSKMEINKTSGSLKEIKEPGLRIRPINEIDYDGNLDIEKKYEDSEAGEQGI